MKPLATPRMIPDLDLPGKCVVVRAGFGLVPPTPEGEWFNDGTVHAVVPTIRALQEGGARVIVVAGVAATEAETEPPSLEACASELATLLSGEVYFPDDCVGDSRKLVQGNLRAGQVCVLENLARHAREAESDVGFAQELGKGIDIYVADAFGSLFDRAASLVELPRYLRERVIGLDLAAQLAAFRHIADAPRGDLGAVIHADDADAAAPWLRVVAKRARHICVVGRLAEALEAQSRSRRDDTAEVAAARTLADVCDAGGAELSWLPARGQRDEFADGRAAAALERARTLGTLLWVDQGRRRAVDELGAGAREFASGFSELSGFTAVIGDALGVALRRDSPEISSRFGFLPTGSSALLKLLEGRRSVALEAIGAAG